MHKQYMLEQAYPYKVEGIGNTKEAGYRTWRWKQIVLSNDLDYLISIKSDDMRIVDWDTCKVVVQADFRYNMIIS